MLHTLDFTLHTLHFLLYTPHSTLHASLCTLDTPYSTLYTLYFCTPHSRLFTLHSTLYTLHSALYTFHFTRSVRIAQSCSAEDTKWAAAPGRNIYEVFLSLCFDMCTVNIHVTIRVRGLHLFLCLIDKRFRHATGIADPKNYTAYLKDAC